ncbi:hypothetical protein [Nocardia vaccinii]
MALDLLYFGVVVVIAVSRFTEIDPAQLAGRRRHAGASDDET